MIVYPAIDIRGGRCVRLVEGDFARETVFDANPSDAAQRWAAAGAEWLHVVDLDGAKRGSPANLDAISAIRATVGMPIQVGGGIRTADDVETLFGLGIDRVILGSVAVSQPELVEELLTSHGDRIAVGMDARDGNLATDGWIEQSDIRAVDLAARLTLAGLRTVIFTDIRRDGTLTGPSLDALTEMITVPGIQVIASGGIGSLDDVTAVARTGAAGVIIGRALYDYRFTLEEAIRVGSEAAQP